VGLDGDHQRLLSRDTIGSAFNTLLAVYTGSAVNSLTKLQATMTARRCAGQRAFIYVVSAPPITSPWTVSMVRAVGLP